MTELITTTQSGGLDLTQIVLALLSLITAVAILYLIPAIKKKYGQEKVNEAMAKVEQIKYWVDMFVKAADGMFFVSAGREKKKYVLEQINNTMDRLGIYIDGESIDAMIESSVLELHAALAGTTYQMDKEELEAIADSDEYLGTQYIGEELENAKYENADYDKEYHWEGYDDGDGGVIYTAESKYGPNIK